ncbi:hypothetical protein HPB50_004820 [Hyalomma asiaticum]|uniref:Uncharacterized protein n=1 Tax=Hyalomma asiaticum TaxID=266040 RepID=A0ACB7SJV3_HYAAI|nr:hypothetical protein HPB50_004820 [Hyalomma asiaticum]
MQLLHSAGLCLTYQIHISLAHSDSPKLYLDVRNLSLMKREKAITEPMGIQEQHGAAPAMVTEETNYSRVAEFYRDRSAFITGGTGFIGKVFDRLRHERPDALGKVRAVVGNLTESDLGLNGADLDTLIENVSIIFHSAATVKFDEPLRDAYEVNVLGTRHVLDLCKKMRNFCALVHVSTAYCNCDRVQAHEIIYPNPGLPAKMSEPVQCTGGSTENSSTGDLLEHHPNTYTFTKALAESLVLKERANLQVAVVRPSIVTAAWKEPFPGWIDNYNATTGIIVVGGLGLLHSVYCEGGCLSDHIPVDVVANTLICISVAEWQCQKELPRRWIECVKVYHCTSGTLNPQTWTEVVAALTKSAEKYPFPNTMTFPCVRTTNSRLWHNLNLFFLHYLPACAADLILLLMGRKSSFVRSYHKIRKSLLALEPFTTSEWKFETENLLELSRDLSPTDKLVLLAKLLRCCPVKRIYLLVRSKRGVEPKARFEELCKCKALQQTKRDVPGAFDKVTVIPGDLALPNLGLSNAHMATLIEEVSVVFHLGAIVRFNDPLASLGEKAVSSTKNLQFGQPNNYSLTKAVTESLLLDEQQGLPLAIVRPSIVTASWREPLPIGMGFLPTVLLSESCVADLIPVDVVANMLICVAWQISSTRPSQLKVYNCTSSALQPHTWGEVIAQVRRVTVQFPLPNARRSPSFVTTTSKLLYWLGLYFVCYIPAFLGDVALRLRRKDASMVRQLRKVVKGMDAVAFYTTNSWLFRSDNMVELMNDLSPKDKQIFDLDIRKLDWSQYWDTYMLGIRKYLFKLADPVLPQERENV